MQKLIRHPDLDGTSVESKVWILIIHYDFSKSGSIKRSGNARDLELLQNLFGEYHDCTFREIASPPRNDIANILSQDDLVSRFENGQKTMCPPTVFMLFIFSHGAEDGVIETEQAGESFTTYDVWDALSANQLLQNCLKINIFGSCRGAQPELRMPPTVKIEVGKNSTCVLGQPNKRNNINFFATVESTMSCTYTTEGSFIVLAMIRQLRALKEEIDILELFRRVQNDVLKNYITENRQTPQVSIFPFRPTLFCARLVVEGAVSSNSKRVESSVPLIAAARCEFYPWSSTNLVFKRGPALIFSEVHMHLAKDFEVALKQLEYSPIMFTLSETKTILKSVSINGLMNNEGSLFVVVIASIQGVEEKSATGLTVVLGQEGPVPIGHLTNNFITSQCATFAEKPKIFIFIDPDVTTNSMNGVYTKGVHKIEDIPIGNNHSGFLTFVGFGKDIADSLIQLLHSSDLKSGKSFLQEKLSEMLVCCSSSTRESQLWSTMPLKVDFPKCNDSYVPHNFIQIGEETVNFTEMVNIVAHCTQNVVLIIAPPGMGKSRASEEMHTQLVLRMSSHIIIYVKLSQTISFWTKCSDNPLVKDFLRECTDEDKLNQYPEREMLFVIDGFDEVCPNFRSKVVTLIKELLVKSKVLITSRPQEKDKIIERLKGVADIINFEIEPFSMYQMVVMLLTRLNLEAKRCKDILTRIESCRYDFTDNPLHLQMLSDTEDIENPQNILEIDLYECFLTKKIKHGLLTYRQIREGTFEFADKYARIDSILKRCAVAQLLGDEQVVISLELGEVMDINLSGVATVNNTKSPLNFVHRTFAEFLTAQHLAAMCFKPPLDEDLDVVEVKLDVCRLFKNGDVEQIMRFFEGFCRNFKDKEIDSRILGFIKEVDKQVFTHICHAGMHNFYLLLFGKAFDGVKVKEWILESHNNSSNGMSLYFFACCSSTQLATALSEWCPQLHIDDVDILFEGLALNTLSHRQCIENALGRVVDWKSRWPTVKFFDKYANSKFSTDCYEFVLENCPEIENDEYLEIFYSKTAFCTEIFPLLLRWGADLNCKKNGISLASIMFRDIHGGGDIRLLNFAIKVAKHFQDTNDVDSEESLLMLKNIGATRPKDLKLDINLQEWRDLYLPHIVQCACALLDTEYCNARSFTSTHEHEFAVMFKLGDISADEMLRPIATAFKLHMMRACDMDEKEALEIFQQERQHISKKFQYSCGCSLAHVACHRSYLQLLKALKKKKIELNCANNKGETVLHSSVCWSLECTEFLLQSFLGQFYVSVHAKLGEIINRTPDEQRRVENILGLRDVKGRTPLISAALEGMVAGIGELVICNLLGPLVIPLLSEELRARTEFEQQQVERILNDRDSSGFSALHGAVTAGYKISFLGFMLKNLLGKYFINCIDKPMQRNLEQQQRIVQLLQPKNNVGVTPLLNCANHCGKDFIVHQLLLMNLLGEFFVKVDKTTSRPLNARTKDENQFVRALMFGEDKDEDRSPYCVVMKKSDEKVKLLYEVNASYLLKTPTRCHIC